MPEDVGKQQDNAAQPIGGRDTHGTARPSARSSRPRGDEQHRARGGAPRSNPQKEPAEEESGGDTRTTRATPSSFLAEMSNFTYEDILEALPERYTIDKILERGGYGQVVKCLTKDSGQAVAVKLPIRKQDTEKEIALLQELMEERMDQQNIIRFIEAFDTKLGKAMVFELLDMSLVGLVNKNNPLPLPDIFSIVQQVATALDVLRERSMVHSDLKLENVMVVNHSQRPLHVKLIDFGLTIPASETGKLLTVHHAMYRPPEVILDAGWNEGLDVWCLGVMMSKMWLRIYLFPNVEYEALRVMHKLLGPPPEHILKKGINTMKFYYPGDYGWDLRAREDVKDCLLPSEIFASLRDLFMVVMEEDENREPAIDLLEKLLDMDMNNRITPKQILKHPAICHEKRSETNKAELQEAPATSPRVIMVKPASPENIIELQEVDVVQKEGHKVLMSREKAHRTFNMTQQKNRRSGSSRAEVQEAPVSSHRVIMVKPALPENTIRLQEGDHGKSVTSVELHSAERTTQRDPIQDQQQSDS